jgi:hypothetical protein
MFYPAEDDGIVIFDPHQLHTAGMLMVMPDVTKTVESRICTSPFIKIHDLAPAAGSVEETAALRLSAQSSSGFLEKTLVDRNRSCGPNVSLAEAFEGNQSTSNGMIANHNRRKFLAALFIWAAQRLARVTAL